VKNVGSLALAGLTVNLLPQGGPIAIARDDCSGHALSVGASCPVNLTATAMNSAAAPVVTETLVVSDGAGRTTFSVAVSIIPGGLTAHLEPDQPLVVEPECSNVGKIVISNNGPEATVFDFKSSSLDLTVVPESSCAVGNIGAGGECSLDLSSTVPTGAPVTPWTVTITGTAGGNAIVTVPLSILPEISVSPTQATVKISLNGGVGGATGSSVGTTNLSVRTGANGALVYDPTSPDAGLMGSALSVYGCNIGGTVFPLGPTGQTELTIAPCTTCELTVLAHGSGSYSRTIAFSDPKAPTVAVAQVAVMVSN